MVEYNHDEERLARIEHIVERLQREQTALTLLTGKLIAAVAVAKPSVVMTYDQGAARTLRVARRLAAAKSEPPRRAHNRLTNAAAVIA